MRRSKYLLINLLAVAIGLVSCGEKKQTFSPDLLIGKWKRSVVAANGTPGFDCYRYDVGGNGVTWDTSDDVSEIEGQAFTWTLSENRLKITHLLEGGGKIPKIYTIKTLNTTTLSYSNDYGESFTFSKFTGNP